MTFNKYRLKGAYHYDWYKTEPWYKYLIDRAVKFCKGRVLDIGCGDGVLLDKLETAGASASGIDNDPDAIKLCNSRALNAYQMSVYEPLPFKVDYIASINVIEHLDNPEVIKEIINKIAMKGAFISTIDYRGGPLGYDHKFEWTYDQMMDFFKEFNPKGFRYKDTEWIGVEIKL